jgi:hypothetical protein
MSERSIYLRDQARKCTRHAQALSDGLTQGELRKLAAKYTLQAEEIERKEAEACPLPPTLWPIRQAPEAKPESI